MGRQRDRNRMAAVEASARERGFEQLAFAAAPRCVGCGLTEDQSPGFRRYVAGIWCLACRKALVGEMG